MTLLFSGSQILSYEHIIIEFYYNQVSGGAIIITDSFSSQQLIYDWSSHYNDLFAHTLVGDAFINIRV